MRRWFAWALAVCLGGLARPAALQAADTEPAGWGAVRGQVVWGEPQLPSADPINVTKDQSHCLAHGPIPREDWVVNPADKGVRYVFVWLVPDSAQAGAKLPLPAGAAKPSGVGATIDQPTCRFEPHVLAIRQGQDLLVKNSAPVVHNVNWAGGIKNPGGNVLLPPKGSFVVGGLKAERLPLQISCNIHPWMRAWVGVFDHPYYAVTDPDGRFEIRQVPAGACRLVVWQESVGYRGGRAGRRGTPITVKPEAVTDVGQLELKSKYE